MKSSQLVLLVAPYRAVVALPLPYTSAVTATTQKYIPLIIIFISLFFLGVVFLVIKLVYMTHRRIGTIHAPPGAVRATPTTSSFRLDKQGNRHRGLLVGCLGSPAWETNLTFKLDRASWRQRQRSSFAYQLHARSTRSASAHTKSKDHSSGSRFTKSTAFVSYSCRADQVVPPPSSGSSRIPQWRGGSSSKALVSAQQTTSSHYGDFGELHGARTPGGYVPKGARRASPSSIRLIDGPSHSNQVEYAFLSALPPNANVVSPLMGTRDSFQLSRCSLKCDRKPVPRVPSLPSFLPFYLPKSPETMASRPPVRTREYLPPLRFSPLASVAKVLHSQHQKMASTSRNLDPDESKSVGYSSLGFASSSKTHDASNVGSQTNVYITRDMSALHPIRKTTTRSNHKGLQSYEGLAIGGSLSQIPLMATSMFLEDEKCPMQTSILCTLSGSSCNSSTTSKKPLKSCLQQNSVGPDATPSMSEISTQTCGTRRSTGDQGSLRTPISDDDIGMLGLDQFHWNDEIKELRVQSCHLKKDSIALLPVL